MTPAEMEAVYGDLLDLHAELQRPLTWYGMQRVLKRAGIRYERVTLDTSAILLTAAGVSVILLNRELSADDRLKVLAHEFAHIQLHAGDPSELVFHIWRPGVDDPREREADYLALRLLNGPAAELPYWRPSARRPQTQKRALIFIEDPYTAARVKLGRAPLLFLRPADPYEDGVIRLQRAPVETPSHRPAADSRKKDRLVPSGKLAARPIEGHFYYSDPEGSMWRIWDVYVILDLWTGKPRRRIVQLGSEIANARYLQGVDEQRRETGEVRFYRFGKGEGRELHVRHLDRQVRQAIPVKSKGESRQELLSRAAK